MNGVYFYAKGAPIGDDELTEGLGTADQSTSSGGKAIR